MNDPSITVLVLESSPGAGGSAADELEAAGHRVVRCTDEGSGRHGLPCVGMRNPERCPLEEHVDVALVRRTGVVPWPTGTERGVVCALRAGIPIVEDGEQKFDPYEDWLAARVDRDTVGTCEEVAARELVDLSDAVVERCRPLLAASYLPLDAMACRIERRPDGVIVRLQFDPEVPASVRQAASVRSVDAVRGMRDRGSTTDVLIEERVAASIG